VEIVNVFLSGLQDFNRRGKHHHPEHCHDDKFIWFVSNNFAVALQPERTINMSDTLHLNQIDNLSIVADDANLNIVPFTPDAPPVWTNSNPAAATMVASADGLTAVLTPVAVGVTTVGVSVVINKVTFSASDDITIVAGAIASISIVATPAPAAIAGAPAASAASKKP
jgi:hypothetical protein